MEPCSYAKKCGGCRYQGIPYDEQLEMKEREVRKLLKKRCPVHPISGMYFPYYYRNKVHAVFGMNDKRKPCYGIYEEGSHKIIQVEQCQIEDKKSSEIIKTIWDMLRPYKLKTYDEDSGYGFLRHVLVRRGFSSNQIMVVLVTASPVFPSGKLFVKELVEKHPEITTIVQSMNDKKTTFVLGDKEKVLYGKGYIEDKLMGYTFRISPKSFYQVNPKQTEVLYKKAIEVAGFTGGETVLDAYCGIGTIGMAVSRHVGQVIGVELNEAAVKDAIANARRNKVENIQFYCKDAGDFMEELAEQKVHVDVVMMDPPRSGSTEKFIDSVSRMKPEKVVYISCNPETLARDLEYFSKKGYQAEGAWPVDMFCFTNHVEIVTCLKQVEKK